MVSVVEKSEISGLGDVILQAFGLTGAITIGAMVFGLVLAAVIIGYRTFAARSQSDEEAAQTQSLGLTPTGKS
jgi:Na+/H+-dicarboxylate symporter